LNKDICDISSNDFFNIPNFTEVDLIIGGPPCQSYSTLGKRQMDNRANLFMQYKRILSILKPKAFMFENVTGILSMDRGNLFKEVQKEFNESGYNLTYKVLNAIDYGVPQIRERVILVGTKDNYTYTFPEPTHGTCKIPYVTIENAFRDLPSLKSGEQSDRYIDCDLNPFLEFVKTTNILTEHKSPKNNPFLIKIMETLDEGQSKDDLPPEIRPKSGFKNTYAKLWWNKPSTTITRNFACPSSSRCIHPRESRALSIREGARLQSFPDNYLFFGSDNMKRLEIGNAVPPLLSLALSKQCLEMFQKSKV